MKALASQLTSHISPAKNAKAAASPIPVSPSFIHPTSTIDHPVIQRKSACACGGGCPSCREDSLHSNIQTKLAISTPGDQYEQEADRVADQVLAAPAHSAVIGAPPRIQRYTGQATAQADTVPASVDQVLASPGRPLDPALQQDMEQRFGHDFSQVRVHTGVGAEQTARDMNANAYTMGRDIVFAEGQYDPSAEMGRKLLAHELTHTIQQSAGGPTRLQRQPASKSGKDEDSIVEVGTIFFGEERQRKDKQLARRVAQADAARIQKGAELSPEDRQLVNAKLNFFEGDAKAEYVRQIKPALVLATKKEIEMPAMYMGKLSDVEPAEQDRIRRRREHTFRYFNKVRDFGLEEAYVSRLQRYVDEGMEANTYWDLEMIEQIIAERAPNAPWHEAARQDFLAKRAVKLQSQARERRLTTLSPYWQNQFGALAEQTKGWSEDARTYARNLLWKWNEHVSKYDYNPYIRDEIQSTVAEEMIFKEIVGQYERVLRNHDRTIQDECRRNPPSGWMKVWGDPCKPWFEDSSQRGAQELRQLQRRMLILGGKGGVPYKEIVDWLEEYMKERGALPTQMAGVHLEILQSWSMVQAGLSMANTPIEMPAGGVGARPTAPALELPPGASRTKVGDIISPGAEVALGPQRVVAVFSEFELVESVTSMPRADRALPPPPPPAGSAIVKAPGPIVSAPTVPPSTMPTPRVPVQLPTPKVPSPLVPKLALHGGMPPAPENLPPAPTPTTRQVTAPGRNATLPIQINSGNTFKSAYTAPPQFRDSERAVGRSLEASSPGWKAQARVKQPKGGLLLSTVPEFLKENVGGATVAAEVKNVALSELQMNYAGWAAQLARRISAITRNAPGTPLQNWVFADLRGTAVELELTGLAARIKRGVAEAGRTGNKLGPTYDKVYFILDDRIVEMP